MLLLAIDCNANESVHAVWTGYSRFRGPNWAISGSDHGQISPAIWTAPDIFLNTIFPMDKRRTMNSPESINYSHGHRT